MPAPPKLEAGLVLPLNAQACHLGIKTKNKKTENVGTLLMVNKNVRKKKPVDKATAEVDRGAPGPPRAKEYASREIKLNS